jgi:hypothetical protein
MRVTAYVTPKHRCTQGGEGQRISVNIGPQGKLQTLVNKNQNRRTPMVILLKSLTLKGFLAKTPGTPSLEFLTRVQQCSQIIFKYSFTILDHQSSYNLQFQLITT